MQEACQSQEITGDKYDTHSFWKDPRPFFPLFNPDPNLLRKGGETMFECLTVPKTGDFTFLNKRHYTKKTAQTQPYLGQQGLNQASIESLPEQKTPS